MELGGFCGLVVKEKNVAVPLTAVNYDVAVRSFASRITIQQTYKNVETTDLECVYGFPINDQAGITGFTVHIDDRIIQSQFKKKDQAFKEYNEALKRGDGAYLLDQADRSDDTFILSVGRLPPQKECIVSISYVCTLESVNETTLRLVIPTALYPRYNPNSKGKKQQIAPPENYQSSVPYLCTLNASIEVFHQVKAVASSSHPISVRLEDENNVKVTFGAQQQEMDKDFVLDIEVKSNPEHYVEVEEYAAGQFAAMFSYVPHWTQEKKKEINSELIFLVDCSGSMRDEKKIDDAKMAMQLFLRSIPEGSYFNFFRFGSNFTALFPESVAYNETSFNQAKEYATETQADMGGTEILMPLKKIYSTKLKPGFSRQIFVLTDGEVSNTEEVINLVRSNASNSRVFSFGLGNSPSRSLVNGMAMAGNGKSEFIKHGEELADKIGRHLSRALQPAVIDASVIWEGVNKVQQVPTSLPPVFFGDRQLVFALFEKDTTEGQTAEVNLQIGSQIKHTFFNLNDAQKMDEDLFINKLAARALIKEIETSPSQQLQPIGSLQTRSVLSSPSDDAENPLVKRITDLSLTFGIISKYVSLLAVEKRQNSKASLMELREIPVQKAFELHPSLISRPYAAPCLMSFGGIGAGSTNSAFNKLGIEVKSKSRITRSSASRDHYIAQSSGPGNSFGGSFGGSFDEPDECKPSSLKKNVVILSAHGPLDDKKSSLNNILALQNWNGTWSANADLIKLLPELSELLGKMTSAGQTLDKDSLTTLIIMTVIESRYKDEINTWKAIIEKASAFISKHLSEKVREDLQKQIRMLLGF